MKKSICWFLIGFVTALVFCLCFSSYNKKISYINQVSKVHSEFDSALNVEVNNRLMISHYEKAIKANAVSKEAGLNLAGAYFSDGQYEKALETFEKYPSDKTFGYYSYFGKALCYYKLKDYEKVIENLDIFIDKNPSFCKEITDNCLPSDNGKKAYYILRAKTNWKLHRYNDWFKDVRKTMLWSKL